jgi:TonB family protein
MVEAVSDIIQARSREPQGLQRMVFVSIALHVVAVAAFILSPRPDYSDDVPRTVMTISLGGAPGPRAGGMTPIGGRSVQAPLPAEPLRRAETAPAPKVPEMALPRENARRPPARPKSSPKEATGRTPTTGPEVREGSTRAETGTRGQGFGLTTGGGGGAGAYLDVGDFCCPEYLETIVQMIQQNWSSKQNVVGQTLMKFTIQRGGAITNVQVERPSGFVALDLAAQRAVLLTERLPALPAQFPNPTLTVHVIFEYQR